MAPFATASIGRPRKPIAYCNTALTAAIMAAVRKVLFMRKFLLMFAACWWLPLVLHKRLRGRPAPIM